MVVNVRDFMIKKSYFSSSELKKVADLTLYYLTHTCYDKRKMSHIIIKCGFILYNNNNNIYLKSNIQCT